MTRIIYLLLLLVSTTASSAERLNVVTTTWAPYNMEEDGALTGIGTDIVRATLERAGVSAEFQVFPWARAYRMGRDQPNTLIYTIIKLPERESQFEWVGPVVPVRSVLHKLKKRDDIQLQSLDDARDYTISTTIKAAGHQYLLSRDFQDGTHVKAFHSNSISVRMLYSERVDLESSVELNFMYEASRSGFSYDEVETALVLFENEGYMAFSKSTPDDLVEKVRTAFIELKSEGVVDEIIQRYVHKYR